jgi:hypothetical protein
MVFIVSIGYKAVSTTTPAAPPAIEPSGIGKGTSHKCSTGKTKTTYIIWHNLLNPDFVTGENLTKKTRNDCQV